MYISNDLVDCVSLDKNKIVIPGYISSFIRMLKEKHHHLIQESDDEPEFLIHSISSPHETGVE
jgi:hypothetical protein